MILDDIKNLGQYYGISRNLDLVIEKMPTFDFETLADGRHEIDGEQVFLNIMHTELGKGGTWEAHRKYIDLQLILEHEETIGWAPLDSIAEFSGYDENRDIMLSIDPQPGTRALLKKSMFGLYFPEDAHQPGIGEGKGRKAVFKIRVEDTQKEASPDKGGLNHQGSQILESERLVIRPYREGDAEAMFENWCGREELGEYLPWAPHKDIGVTKAVLSEWVKAAQNPKYYHWGIEMSGKLIGDIAVMQQSENIKSCEIGYCLSPDDWNKGIMTEALKRVMRFLYEDVGFHRIQLRHQVGNDASGKVMQKAGLHFEGVMRGSVLDTKGEYADAAQYAAIQDEWLKEFGN